MSDSKHTPGPWEASAVTHFDSGLTYVSVRPVTPDPETMRPLLMANKEYHICRMTHTAAQHAIAMHIANASLIAAAPDLLAAVERLMDQPTMNPIDMTTDQRKELWAAHAEARAAIAKATNTTPQPTESQFQNEDVA